MSNCAIKIKTLDFLKGEGVLSSDRKIIKADVFDSYNKSLTELAFSKYNVGDGKSTLLFSIELANRKFRAIPNDKLFDLLEIEVENMGKIDIRAGRKGVIDLIQDKETNFFPSLSVIDISDYSDSPSTLPTINTNNYLFPDEISPDKNKTFEAIDILRNIRKNVIGLSSITSDLLTKKADLLLQKTKAKVKIIKTGGLKNTDTLMQYNRETNTIEIDLEALNMASPEAGTVAFLHEVFHSISVNFYNEGVGIDADIFRSVVNDAFATYKRSDDDIYQFSNPLEFIAEAFSSPTFQAELRSRDSGRGKSIWNELVSAIRRIFGLGSRLTKSDKVVNEIMQLATNYDATSSDFPAIYETKKEKGDIKDFKTDLDTLEKKFIFTMDKVDQSIEINMQRLTQMAKRQKDEVIQASLEGRVATLKALRDNIEISRETNKALAITAFVNNMKNAMLYIESALQKMDYKDTQKVMQTVSNYNDYLMTFSVIEDIQKVLSEAQHDSVQDLFTTKELQELRESLSTAKGRFDTQMGDLLVLKKKAMTFRLNDIKYFPKVLTAHKEKLEKEWISIGKPGNKNDYINDKLVGRDSGKISDDVSAAVTDFMENAIFDIYKPDISFSAAVGVSAPLIQILHNMLVDIDNERLPIEREYDVKATKVFAALRKEKGTSNVRKLYENILEKDKNGKWRLKGEWNSNFLIEVRDKIRKIHADNKEKLSELTETAKQANRTFGTNSVEYSEAKFDATKLTKEIKSKIDIIRSANLIMEKDGRVVSPKVKWKNSFSGLSKAEKDALDLFKETVDKGDEITYGRNSLKQYNYGVFFYELPSIIKSTAERVYQGQLKGALRDKFDYITRERADDTEYTVKKIDLGSNTLKELRVHYRNYNDNFKNEDQSLDLSSIFRLEFKNINMYDIRKTKETELNFLLAIAKDKNFYEKDGSFLIKNKRNDKLNISKNTNNNIHTMMNNMMDMRFYDIMVKNRTKFGKIDANKAVNWMNAGTSFIALSLNIASGTANVVNANAQMFLETIFKGDKFTASNIAKANRIYATDLAHSLKDIINPINTSYTNQIAELFNVRGLFNLSESNFLQATLVKKGLDMKSLQVFQDSGEHWIQAILTMSVLDNIKVMNAKHKYIDKNGKEVSEKQAASILDMLKPDPITGVVELNEKVIYTNHSTLTKWNEGGKAMVDTLIRKKMDDTIGNYTQTQQADVFRHYLGKLGMLYRKYLIPMGQARLRGWESVSVSKKDLREDQRTYSYALQQYEEGTYITLIRYLITSLFKTKTGLLAGVNWKQLSTYEKHNMKRAVVEVFMTTVILPITINLLAAMAEGMDGDDDNEIFFLMYQLRRAQTELSAYWHPKEMFKMLKSPIPSARLIEAGISIFTDVFSPGELDAKGNNVLYKDIQKLNPWRQITKDYQRIYNYQRSSWGSN